MFMLGKDVVVKHRRCYPHMISRESCIAHSRWIGKAMLLTERKIA